MDTVTMVADIRQTYNGRGLLRGDEFDVTPAEAADLVALRMATRKKVHPVSAAPVVQQNVPAVESPVYESRDVVADTDAEDKDSSEVKSSQKPYNRRDMRARR